MLREADNIKFLRNNAWITTIYFIKPTTSKIPCPKEVEAMYDKVNNAREAGISMDSE